MPTKCSNLSCLLLLNPDRVRILLLLKVVMIWTPPVLYWASLNQQPPQLPNNTNMLIRPTQEEIADFSSVKIFVGKTWVVNVGQKLTFLFRKSFIWACGVRPNTKAPTLSSNAISGSGSASSAQMEVIGMSDYIEPCRDPQLNPDTDPDIASPTLVLNPNFCLSNSIASICFSSSQLFSLAKKYGEKPTSWRSAG